MLWMLASGIISVSTCMYREQGLLLEQSAFRDLRYFRDGVMHPYIGVEDTNGKGNTQGV
jgi:hypothetical protein